MSVANRQAANDPEGSELEFAAWPDEWLRALSDASLGQASSADLVQRGKIHATGGAVEVVEEHPMPEPALQAEVTDTEIHTTEVWIEDDTIAGSCDCASAEDGRFCEHQVAVALVWRDRLTGHAARVALPAGNSARSGAEPARTFGGERQALHDFLHAQEASTLAEKLLEFVDRDQSVSRELQQWRKASEMGNDPAHLEPLISELLAPGQDYIAWNETPSYVRRAESVLPLLQRARTRDADAAAPLCLGALRRVWDVLQQADDSNDDIGGLCRTLAAEWVLSLEAAGPQPASFGDVYLQVQLDDPFGCIDAVAAEAAIGEPALARCRRAVEERWRRAKDAVAVLKAEHATKVDQRKGWIPAYDETSERELRLWTLESLHLAQLESANQVDDALAVLREDLSEAGRHSRVVTFLEKHGRFREALAQAEQSRKAFPDDWRLDEALLRCYEREGLTAEALALRREQFEQRPGVESYHLVLKAGLAAGHDMRALRQSLIDHLAAREVQIMTRPPYSARYGSPPTATPPVERDVSLRAEVLGSEGRWIEACTLVQPPAICREGVLTNIARHLPAAEDAQARALLLRVFGNAMQTAKSPYRDVLVLVEEIGRRMDAARRTAWLAQLRIDFKAKRDFIRNLPER